MSFIKLNQALAATFNRGSNATKQDGTSVSGNIVRYENAATTPVINKQRLWDRGTHTRTVSTTNLLTLNQSNCENFTSAVEFESGWSRTATTTLTKDSAKSWQGTYSIRCDATATNGGLELAHANYVQLAANTTYTASAWVWIPSGQSVQLEFMGVNVTVVGTDSWQRIVSTATSTIAAGYSLDVRSVAPSTYPFSFWVDAFQVEQGSVVTDWKPGRATTGLELSSSPRFTRSGWAYNQIGQAITANTPRYGTTIDVLGATNLLGNSNFETGNATSWSLFYYGASGAISATTVDKYSGTYSGLLDGGNGGAFIHQSPGNNGLNYTLSCVVKIASGTGTIATAAPFAVVNNSLQSWDSQTNLGNGWYRCVKANVARSNGTWGVLAAGGFALYVDEVQIEQNTVATPYTSTNRPTTYLQDSVLIEEGSTNLAQFSEQFNNAYWTKSNATVTADAVYAPNGTLTADKLVETATFNSHYVGTSAATFGTNCSFSVYLKAAERSWGYLQIGAAGAYFDLSTGTVGSITGAGGVGIITYVGDGWYRCTYKTSSAGSAGVFIMTATGNNGNFINSSGGTGLYIWGAQVETKAYPTSYIPTPSNASVARSAESVSVASAGILNATAGTVVVRAYCESDISNSTSTGLHILFDSGFNVASVPNRIVLYSFGGTPTQYYAQLTTAAGTAISTSLYSATLSGWHTFAIRWSSSELSLWIDGVKRGFNASVTLPTAIASTFSIGSGLSGTNWNSAIEEVNIFNAALSDADMTVYTAASGAVIPMRAETTWKAEFDGNLNFATSGVYVSEWFNVGASGAIFSGYSAPNNAASGCVYLYEFQMSDSDTQATTTAWLSAPSSGKYVRARITMVSTLTNSTLPTTTSLTINPSDTSKGVTIEEGVVNLFAAPAVPVAEEIAVTAGSPYTLSTYGVDASSGSVVIEHKRFLDTQADFDAAATYTNAQSLASGAIALTTHADPTFTRATAATKRDGTQVQSGYTRYEDVIKNALIRTQGDWDAGTKVNVVASPGTYVQDAKRYESMLVNNSADYTAAGQTTTWTWNVANQRLEGTTTAFAHGTYVFNNFSAKDVSVECTITQSENAGLIARYQDANNWYSLAIRDDSSATPTVNLEIFKRVAGVSTSLNSGDFTITRGTSYRVRYEIVGNEHKAYLNDVLAFSVTDASFTTAGQVGVRALSNTTAAYFTSLKYAQLIPGGKLTTGQFVDGFDVDSSGQYTLTAQAGTTAVTYNTAQSRAELTNSGPSNGWVLFNNYSAKDVAVESVISQADWGGITVRYTDVNNNYTLMLRDNTAAATNNFFIVKRVAGVQTALATVTATITRGTQYTVRFEVIGNELKAYLNGVLLTSVTDSSLSSTGSVGMYVGSATVTYNHSFTIDQLSPLFSRPSAATRAYDGTSVARNIPRYEYGRNLLGNNGSSAEINSTTGVGTIGGPVSFGRDTTQAWQGAASFQVTYNVAGGGGNHGMYAAIGENPVSDRPIFIKPNTAYTFSFYTKCDAGWSGAALRAFIYDGATNVMGSKNFTPTTSWVRVTQTFTTPATGLIDAWHFLRIDNNGAAVVGKIYFDGLQVEEGSTATTWNVGGPSAIMVEEGTTNGAGGFIGGGAENFSTNWSTFGGSSVTAITSGQVDPFGGTNAYRVQINGASATNVLKYYTGHDIPGSGAARSLSVWIKNNQATAVIINDNFGHAVTVNQSDGWKLVKIENTIGNASSSFQLRMHTPSVTDNIDCFAMYPQTESKAYCTSYIAPGTTRAAENVTIQSTAFGSSMASGTIIIRAYVDGDMLGSAGSAHHLLFDNRVGGSTNGVAIRKLSGQAFDVVIANGSTASTTTTFAISTAGWYTIAARWNAAELSLWVNGTKRGTIATPVLPVSVNPGALGAGIGNQYYCNVPIDEFNYFPVYLDDATMASYTSL